MDGSNWEALKLVGTKEPGSSFGFPIGSSASRILASISRGGPNAGVRWGGGGGGGGVVFQATLPGPPVERIEFVGT